ncbi:lipid droplet-associated hydrolase-like isoform X2 [Haliotis rufescens]|nr:lipid droplet-associated hydrolase-like isoform X2 [Haliotis rufescens]XP_048257439.1 lipid droplet-associated hydrolase-like isoform X2 [Haliotis rufescens]
MEKDSGMRSEFQSVIGVDTHVLKFGELPPPSQHTALLFLIIPGNPGIIEYYEEFMRTLYHLSNCQTPVWGIAHAGHVSLHNRTSSLTDLVQMPPDEFSLQGQIRHKIAFVRQNVPEHVKIVMIGHSIGCYIGLKMMDSLQDHHVLRCFMLFPTIERMAVSPRGLYATPFLRYFRWMGVLASKFLSYFSPHMQYRLILRFFKNRKAPECALNASMNLFDPCCVNNFTFMALQEMDEVTKLPKELIKRYLSKLSFYYGSSDHWCPKEYFYQMKKRFPHADLRLCEHGYSHAFILDASEEIAYTVWNWLQGDLHKLND